jgi:hypothetical protein
LNKLVIDNIGLYNENKDDEQGKALKAVLDDGHVWVRDSRLKAKSRYELRVQKRC